MIERTLIITAICNISSPNVNLRDIITDDGVFVLSPYLLVQCLPYSVQVEPVVQEIVRPHYSVQVEMNFKFRNKIICHK